MNFVLVLVLAVVMADATIPELFAGYERGGYEIQTGNSNQNTGTGPSQYPGETSNHDSSQFSAASQDPSGYSDLSGTQNSDNPGSFQNGGKNSDGSESSGEDASRGSTSQFINNGEELQENGEDNGSRQQNRGSERFSSGTSGENGGSNRNGNRNEDDDQPGGDLDNIPGEPGKDYPIYGEIPETSFRCEQQPSPGYYADVETQCQVFHICQKSGLMNSALCPNGTIFNQKVFVCSWWYDFDCDQATSFFSLNEQVNAEGEDIAARIRQEGRSTEGGRNGAGYSNEDQNNERILNNESEENGESSRHTVFNSNNNQNQESSRIVSNSGGDSNYSEENTGYLENGSNSERNSVNSQTYTNGEANSLSDSKQFGHPENNQNNFGNSDSITHSGQSDVNNGEGETKGYSDNGPNTRGSGRYSQQSSQNIGNTRQGSSGYDSKSSSGPTKFTGEDENNRNDGSFIVYSDNGPNGERARSGVQNDFVSSHQPQKGSVSTQSNGYSTDGSNNGSERKFENGQDRNDYHNSQSNLGESGEESGYPRSRNGNARRGNEIQNIDDRNTRKENIVSGHGRQDAISGYSSGPPSLLDLIVGPRDGADILDASVDGALNIQNLSPSKGGQEGVSEERSYLPPSF